MYILPEASHHVCFNGFLNKFSYVMYPSLWSGLAMSCVLVSYNSIHFPFSCRRVLVDRFICNFPLLLDYFVVVVVTFFFLLIKTGNNCGQFLHNPLGTEFGHLFGHHQ